MAGSQIAVPANGASDWSDFVTIVQRNFRAWMQLNLTNIGTGNTSEPAIAAGSALEVGGAFYSFDSEEAITGWGAISNSTSVWIKVIPDGSSITAEFTDTDPTWSDAKQGWYDGVDRYVGWLRRDSSGTYLYKHVLPIQYQYNLLLEDEIEIGDWNMNTSALNSVDHEMVGATDTIRKAQVYIQPDIGNNPHRVAPLLIGDPSAVGGNIQQWGDSDVAMYRIAASTFDSVLFEDTSYNRGWIQFHHLVLVG